MNMIWDKKLNCIRSFYSYSREEIFDLRKNGCSIKPPKCFLNLKLLDLNKYDLKPIQKVPETHFLRISLDQNIELSKTENAWKPSNLNEEQILQNQKTLLKRFRSSLNKLTPENFDVLLKQLKKSKIETPTDLSGVVALIFEKAVDEPNFATTYTKLCSELQSVQVYDNLNGTKIIFKKVLLSHAQMEFENVVLERRESMKLRKRSCGTVIFIGELFNAGLLINEIMHQCIKLLLQEREDFLESLCKFLTIIGSKMENKQSDGLKEYLGVMREIVKIKPKNINVRIRFMIQDLIDLKMKNWISRVVKPTKLEAVEISIKNEEVASKILKENNKKEKEEKTQHELEPKKISFVGALEINGETQLGSASQFCWKLNTQTNVKPTAGVQFSFPSATFSISFTQKSGGFDSSSGDQTPNKSLNDETNSNQKRNSSQKSMNYEQKPKRKTSNSTPQKSNFSQFGKKNKEYSGEQKSKQTERKWENAREKSNSRDCKTLNNSSYPSTGSNVVKNREFETLPRTLRESRDESGWNQHRGSNHRKEH